MTRALQHIADLGTEIGQLEIQRADLDAEREYLREAITRVEDAMAVYGAFHDLAGLRAFANANGWGALVEALVDAVGDYALDQLLQAGWGGTKVEIEQVIADLDLQIEQLDGDIAADQLGIRAWQAVYDAAQAAFNNDISQITALETQLNAMLAQCGQ